METKDVELLYIVRITGSSLSIVGCLFIVVMTVILGRHRYNTHVRLIMCMALCALLEASSELLGDQRDNGFMCKFQAILSHCSDWALGLYVACIAFHVHQIINRENYNVDRWEKYYHLSVWLISAAFTCVPLIGGDHYGPAGAWCWITKKGDGDLLRFISWCVMLVRYFPLTVIFLYMAVTYLLVLRHMSKQWSTQRQGQGIISSGQLPEVSEAVVSMARRMRLYPVMFMLIWSLPLAGRIHDWIAEDRQLAWLSIAAAATHSIQGALYAVVYGLDDDTVARLRYCNVYLRDIVAPGGRAPEARVQRYYLGDERAVASQESDYEGEPAIHIQADGAVYETGEGDTPVAAEGNETGRGVG